MQGFFLDPVFLILPIRPAAGEIKDWVSIRAAENI
jgi:hypothetical protein